MVPYCSHILPPNFIVNGSMVHCGTLCRAIPLGNRRADDIRPYADGATELLPSDFVAWRTTLRVIEIFAPGFGGAVDKMGRVRYTIDEKGTTSKAVPQRFLVKR